MAQSPDAELTFILEDEGHETPTGSLRPEFEEIPPRLRSEVEAGLREEAFDLLHAEAVERGELEAAPTPAPGLGASRTGLRSLLMLAVGAMGGAAAVAAATALLRWVTATLR